MACNFNCLVEIEGFFNVARSHIHGKKVLMCYKCCNTERRCYYRSLMRSHTSLIKIVAILMTVSGLLSRPPIASLLKCVFSYNCAAVDKISTDSASRGSAAIVELLFIACQQS